MARALLIELAGCPVAIPTGGGRCEVLAAGHATALPGAAPLLLGLSAIHGRAVPLVNLTHLLGQLGLTRPELSVFTESTGESLALPADRTLGLIELPATPLGTDILSTPLTLPHPGGEGSLQVQVLNIQALLDSLRQHLDRV